MWGPTIDSARGWGRTLFTARCVRRVPTLPVFFLLLSLLVLPGAVAADRDDWSGFVAVEGRGFPSAGLTPEQGDRQASLVLQPEYYREWADGRQSFHFTPFLRIDSLDRERTHVDLRELYWQQVGSIWELSVGARKVFWGVTESRHLVDIINQTDAIEDVDGEEKLGQPMVRLDWILRWGTWELYILPGFRERTFPGSEGRLRTPIPVDTDRPIYEPGARNLDAAIRWSHYFGPVDIAVSHFSGTGREPRLVPTEDGALRPLYEPIQQTGLELQVAAGAWLLKGEAFVRHDSQERFAAAVGGVEYTFSDVRGSGIDVGVLFEYLYDGRTTQPELLQDDVFAGIRLAFNDVQSTDLLIGVIVDRETGARLFSLEGSRRIGERWKLEVCARMFSGSDPADASFVLRHDDYLQIGLARYF